MNKKGADKPLTPEDHHLYRKGVGILLYLAPERPGLIFTLKKLSMKPASPTEGDLQLLRFVGNYLKGCLCTLVAQEALSRMQFSRDQT